MFCPKCSNEMAQVVKHEVTIDTCTTCGGVWLDKGKLGDLIARVNQAGSSLDQELARAQDYGRSYHHERDRHHDDDHDDHGGYKRRKRSIFDIFD
jgi:Zn-finger nucleic acid-binding protein